MRLCRLKKNEQFALLEALGLQRKTQTTKMMAGVEEKVTDMTESLKTNMQKMAKASNPFNYRNP